MQSSNLNLDEPYRRPGRRRRRGPGPAFHDWSAKDFPHETVDARQLVSALCNGDMQLAQGLLMSKADPNVARNESGLTPLHYAAGQGFVGVCRHILNGAADLNAVSTEECLTALHWAVLGGHMLVMKLLLEAEACVNAASPSGDTALSLAVNDGKIEAIQQLLKANAQVDFRSEEEFPGLSLPGSPTVSRGSGGIYASARPTSAGSSTSALLRAAQRNAQKQIFEELVAAGCDLNAKDDASNQPLHLVCKNNCTNVVRFLLEKGADPNCANRNQQTPLHYAAGAGVPRTVRILAERGADVNREDVQGRTPLFVACDPITANTLTALGARSRSVPTVPTSQHAAARSSTGGLNHKPTCSRPLRCGRLAAEALSAGGGKLRGGGSFGQPPSVFCPSPASSIASPASPKSPLSPLSPDFSFASPPLSPAASAVGSPLFATSASKRFGAVTTKRSPLEL